MVSVVYPYQDPHQAEEDVRSVRSVHSTTSTIASTSLSLASRIAALSLDFNDKHSVGGGDRGDYEDRCVHTPSAKKLGTKLKPALRPCYTAF